MPMKYESKALRGGAYVTHRYVSMDAIHLMSEILSLLTLMGKFPSLSAMADL